MTSYTLNGPAAMKRFWEALDDSPFIMIGLEEPGTKLAPMTAYFDDDLPNRLYLYTPVDNRLVQGVSSGISQARISFESKGHDLFASLRGTLSIVRDTTMLDRFWSDTVAAWFDGGRQDPNLRMLEVDLHEAEVWLADLDVIGKLQLAFGGAIGKPKPENKHVEVAL